MRCFGSDAKRSRNEVGAWCIWPRFGMDSSCPTSSGAIPTVLRRADRSVAGADTCVLVRPARARRRLEASGGLRRARLRRRCTRVHGCRRAPHGRARGRLERRLRGAAGAVDDPGRTLALALRLLDIPNGTLTGAASVFRRTGQRWTQDDELTAFDGAADDRFGYSVGLLGDTATVARRTATPGPDAPTPSIGHELEGMRRGVAGRREARRRIRRLDRTLDPRGRDR